MIIGARYGTAVMAETVSIADTVTDINSVLTGAGRIVESLQNLHTSVSTVVDTVNADIKSISKHEKSQTKRVRNAYKSLKDAAQKLLKVVDEADYIVQIGGDKKRLNSIKKSLNLRSLHRRQLLSQQSSSPDHNSLVIFTDQLKSAIARVEQAYQEFKEAILAAVKATTDAASEAKSSELKARHGREAIKRKGLWSTCFLAAAAGIGLSFLAGPLVGATAATMVAAAGAGTTYSFNQSYAQLQDKYKKQLSLLNEWTKCADEMEDKVDDLHRVVEVLSVVVDDLKYNEPKMTEFSFSMLQKSFTDIDQTCESGRKTTTKLKDKLHTTEWDEI